MRSSASRLNLAVLLLLAIGVFAGLPPGTAAGSPDDSSLTRLELTAVDGDVEGLERFVTAAGGTVELISGGRVQALVDEDGREAIEAARDVARVERPGTFLPLQVASALEYVGATTWQNAGFTGYQVKVAVLDAGFRGYESRLGVSLPGRVTTQSFRSDGQIAGGSEHGRRAAEVVHAVAPGADLYLVNFSTVTELSAAVDYLIAEDVDIVSFSLGYIHNGPGDGTGPVNQIVSRGVDAGQLWTVASGNWAQQHWSGTFRDSDGDTVHEFEPGVTRNEHEFQAGDRITVSLRWDEPWGAACSDYDLELFGPAGALVRASRNVQNCSQDPVEAFQVLAIESGTYSVRVVQAQAEIPRELSLMVVGTPDRGLPLAVHTLGSSLSEPADHPGVVTVGALTAAPERVEASYSSRGPTTDGRFKPNLLSPTGGNALPGGSFGGTSAAAPHVAGAAALLAEAFPGSDASRLSTLLQTRAIEVPVASGGSGARRVDLGSLFGVGALLPPRAGEATISGALPSGPGIAFVAYEGPNGYPARFTHLLTGLQPVRSVWRLDAEERWQSFVPGVPTWVNSLTRFDNGDALVVVLGAP